MFKVTSLGQTDSIVCGDWDRVSGEDTHLTCTHELIVTAMVPLGLQSEWDSKPRAVEEDGKAMYM